MSEVGACEIVQPRIVVLEAYTWLHLMGLFARVGSLVRQGANVLQHSRWTIKNGSINGTGRPECQGCRTHLSGRHQAFIFSKLGLLREGLLIKSY